jgi:hypothetical protein
MQTGENALGTQQWIGKYKTLNDLSIRRERLLLIIKEKVAAYCAAEFNAEVTG